LGIQRHRRCIPGASSVHPLWQKVTLDSEFGAKFSCFAPIFTRFAPNFCVLRTGSIVNCKWHKLTPFFRVAVFLRVAKFQFRAIFCFQRALTIHRRIKNKHRPQTPEIKGRCCKIVLNAEDYFYVNVVTFIV
jgi:hypothetical protein